MRRPFILLTLAALLSVGEAAHAVPARRGLKAVKLADGTELMVQLVGDEHFHYYLSEDGHVLINDDDTYYYGDVDAQGQLVKSPMTARPAAERSAETRAYLEQVDRSKVMEALRRQDSSVRAARMARAPKAPQRTRIGLFDTGFPAEGDQKGLVILVEYRDVKFNLEDPHDYFSRMLNEDGFSDYGGTGSAAEYFRESSMGKFRPQFDVYGPVTLANGMRYYGGNDMSGNDVQAWKMVTEACAALDDEVDFTQYDRDGDGEIDNVFVFYAGLGEATSNQPSTVWPHAWYISAADPTKEYVFDGVKVDRYACSNEWVDNRPDGVGTFVHEFSHVLGLPDLYSTDASTSPFTPGEWSVLDLGPYNNDGCTPPLYSIYERYSLGWMEPVVLDGPANVTMADIGTNVGCIVPTEKNTEFFLLENRQQKGWDTYLPGHGMLVWHIDYNPYVWLQNTVNNDATHQYVDLEEADGLLTYSSMAGDAFPGTAGITSFTDETVPSMLTWSGKSLGLPLTDIAETDSLITFKVAGGGDELSVTGIGSTTVATAASVRLMGQTLVIDAAVGERIVVSDALGRTLFAARSDGSRLTVPIRQHGIIAVRVGLKSYKVVR